MYIGNPKVILIAKMYIRSLVVCAMIKFEFYFEKACENVQDLHQLGGLPFRVTMSGKVVGAEYNR